MSRPRLVVAAALLVVAAVTCAAVVGLTGCWNHTPASRTTSTVERTATVQTYYRRGGRYIPVTRHVDKITPICQAAAGMVLVVDHADRYGYTNAPAFARWPRHARATLRACDELAAIAGGVQ